jgi:UPF0716 family protein affecting phage T7 exclusion
MAMSVPLSTAEMRQETRTADWHSATRIAFRFCFVYLTLFGIYTQILPGLISIPMMEEWDPSAHWPIPQVISWIAAHVFQAKLPLVYTGSGSGDKTFDWVLAFFLLVLAAVATVIWSFLDRQRSEYVTLNKWFRVFIRFALASQLIGYGMDKVVPLQMPFPYLTRLLEPFGNFSPMGVLWASIGASPAYETFAGCAETIAGVLLIFPRTTMLGALIALADMTQVFMLNMTYDVPVKLFSFHLLLMALLLLAPDIRRLVDFFFSNRAVMPSTKPQLFTTRRANRIAFALQVAFGLWMIGTTIYGAWKDWHQYGGGRAKSALYGIWNVEELSIDGQIRSPLLTDYDRWRRAIFDFPQTMAFQRMDDSLVYFGTSISQSDKTIALTKGSDKNWKGTLRFERPSADHLVLDGEMDNHKLHMELHLVDRNKFLLVSRGFRWIQQYPFNR